MNIEQLQIEISKAEQKLANLQFEQTQKREAIYNNGGEVIYHTLKDSKEKEIIDLRKKIMYMKEQLKVLQINKELSQVSNMSKLSEQLDSERELKKQEKEYRLQTFKQVKNMYEKSSFNKKFINIINGKKPKWNVIKAYSQEELNMLIRLKQGRTERQKDWERAKRKRLEEKGLSEKEINFTFSVKPV